MPSHLPGLTRFWDDFKSLEQDLSYFVTARLFEGTPAVWPVEVDYVRWRHSVAQLLQVDPMGVHLVGSARLGYSLNPGKNFKPFDDTSDLDIAIVSPEIFEQTWRELRLLLNSREFEDRKTYLRKLVFDECIALDIVLPRLSIGERWSKARDSIAESIGIQLGGRELNYRLYRSHSALRDYQLAGVETARDRAIEEGVHDA